MTGKPFRLPIWILVAYWLMLCILTHLPPGDLPRVQANDKIGHFAAFGLLGLMLRVVLHRVAPRHGDWLTVAIILAYGALDEWLQPLTGRSCEFGDWLANGAGAAAAIFLFNLALLPRRLWPNSSSTLVEDHRKS